jgi:D-sedoheptulose 7-phosphate isomerase
MKFDIKREFDAHLETANSIYGLIDELAITAQHCIDSLKNGGKILLFGNGGSAADAQHIAAELVGRYKLKRKGLAAIALTADTSSITSISNDFGYNLVFKRQIEALANKGDVLIGISTSGKSKNVLKGLKIAAQLNCISIGLSGQSGGEMNTICDVNLVIPSEDTPRIQEMHILLGHTLCNLIDEAFTI